MSKKLSLSLAAVCVAALTSGMANAATEIGKGTLTMNGSISTTTCTVTPSTTSVTFPPLAPSVIEASVSNTVLASQPVSFDFKDCGVVGDSLDFTMTRGAMPPNSMNGNAYFGGFTFAGGTSTDASTAPIAYRVGNGLGKYMTIDGSANVNNTFDLTAVQDKSAFSIPTTLEVTRPAAGGLIPAAQYVGTYTGTVQYAIAYP